MRYLRNVHLVSFVVTSFRHLEKQQVNALIIFVDILQLLKCSTSICIHDLDIHKSHCKIYVEIVQLVEHLGGQQKVGSS